MLWFDLDNSPHVPLFRPILRELGSRRHEYILTARDFAQTRDLLDLWKIPYTLIGKHGGRSKIRKVANLLHRSYQLRQYVSRKDLSLAVSHGSRTQTVAARWMRLPSLVMLDYEYTEHRIFSALASYLLMPSLIPEKRLAAAGFNLRKILRYDGFKEELYISEFTAQKGFRQNLGFTDDHILVTLRPPSLVGNYHDESSEQLFGKCLEHFLSSPQTICLVVSRNASDRKLVPIHLKGEPRVQFLKRPVDGLQLLWHSDVVVSGGGTMNREAALLGVPVYSIFTGRRPYLDEYLQDQGKIKFIERISEIPQIAIQHRAKIEPPTRERRDLVVSVTELLIDISTRKN